MLFFCAHSNILKGALGTFEIPKLQQGRQKRKGLNQTQIKHQLNMKSITINTLQVSELSNSELLEIEGGKSGISLKGLWGILEELYENGKAYIDSFKKGVEAGSLI
jgi:hypothetical protein